MSTITHIEDQDGRTVSTFESTIGDSGSDQAKRWMQHNSMTQNADGSWTCRWSQERYFIVNTPRLDERTRWAAAYA